MDVLLPILQVLFFAPVLIRLATGSGAHAQADLRQSWEALRHPGIFIQLVGGVGMFGGTTLALVTERVSRPVTPQGVVGAAIILIAVVLLSWSLATLRSWRFLPEVDTNHELCTAGPYALVRHPMYLAIDLLALGVAIWVPSVAIIIGAVALVVGGDVRAREEERVLLKFFGERYRDYMGRVRRTIPKIY